MKSSDIPHVQQANITNLPENYFAKYYLYHVLTWPQLSYVAVDVSLLSSEYLLSYFVEEFGRHAMDFYDCLRGRNIKAEWLAYASISNAPKNNETSD